MRGLTIFAALVGLVLLAAAPAEAGWIFRGGCANGQCGGAAVAASPAEAAPEAPIAAPVGDCGKRAEACLPDAATGPCVAGKPLCGVVQAGKAVAVEAGRVLTGRGPVLTRIRARRAACGG